MPKTILFHSATGGVGRTLFAVSIAAHFAEVGKVMFIDSTNSSHNYFFKSEPTPTSSGYCVPNVTEQSGYLDRKMSLDNIHVYPDISYYYDQGDKYDTVIFNDGDRLFINENLWSRIKPDYIVTPYLNNKRSILNTLKDLEFFDRISAAKNIPVQNMDEGRSEHDLGNNWDDNALKAFQTYFLKLTNSNREEALRLFHWTSLMRQSFLSFGQRIIPLHFRRSDPSWPGSRIFTLFTLLNK